MKFKIHYKYNPLQIDGLYYKQRGNYLLANAQKKFKELLIKHDKRINYIHISLQAIRGLSLIYNFRFHTFLRDNFKHPTSIWWIKNNQHYHRMNLSKWIKVIQDLDYQCQRIHTYKSISYLIHSKYSKYITIDGIQHFYHPRRHRFVKNARTKLAKLGNNKRYTFASNFVRFGSKPNGQLTILLINIFYKDTKITNHLWFNATKAFKKLGHLNTGDIIIFQARVKKYRKGYLPNSFQKLYDYHLSYPSHIKVIHV